MESEVLAAITHRTNLPASWRRISLDKVGQAILQGKMAALLAQANASGDAEAISEYVELLKAADDELRGKEAELVQRAPTLRSGTRRIVISGPTSTV